MATMTLTDMIARVRRLIEEVDLATSDYADQDITESLGDALTALTLRSVGNLVSVSLDTVTSTLTPSPITLEQGEMLSLQAAADILSREYRGKVSRGELGASWTSGLEGESTVSAARLYAAALADLQASLKTLILIDFAPTTGVRSQ